MRTSLHLRHALVAVVLIGSTLLFAAPLPTEEAATAAELPKNPAVAGAPSAGASTTPGFFSAPGGQRALSQRPGASAPGGQPRERHEFYFTRAVYTSYRGRGRGYGSWAVDYPEADRHFAEVIERVVGLDVYDYENAVSLADPQLRRFPILYALEVGRMALTQDEIHGLRDYLNAGGFLIIDDFWGTQEWEVFEYNMRMVLPGRPMVEMDLDHPVFSIFFEITELLQVPNVRQGVYGGPTWERDGYEPHVLGIFDDRDRLMVVINWNTDLGDAWEWSDDPFYPLKYSTFAYEMGANFIVYGMSH